MDLGKKILGPRGFDLLMKMTFYGQFVAGEDHRAIGPLIRKNQAFGVGSVLDYGVEEDIGQDEAEQKEPREYESCGITMQYSRYYGQKKMLLSLCCQCFKGFFQQLE